MSVSTDPLKVAALKKIIIMAQKILQLFKPKHIIPIILQSDYGLHVQKVVINCIQ